MTRSSAADLGDLLRLDIRGWGRTSLLHPGLHLQGAVPTIDGDPCDIDLIVVPDGDRLAIDARLGKAPPARIGLDRTCSPYGHRTWFVCSECKRRRGILFISSQGVVACRDCLRFPTRAFRLSRDERALDVLDGDHFGDGDDPFAESNWFPRRPARMRAITFRRLSQRAWQERSRFLRKVVVRRALSRAMRGSS